MSEQVPVKSLRFVDWHTVSTILDYICTDGVQTAVLFKSDGSVISSGGDTSNADTIGAIMMNLWDGFTTFRTVGTVLDMLVIDCENGQIAAIPIGDVYLCLLADNSVTPGMLQLKINILNIGLSDLNCVAVNNISNE